MTDALIAFLLLVAAVCLVASVVRARRHDPWRKYTPPSNLDRELRWIERHAAPWETDQRKQRALERRRRDNALDQRVASLLARPRQAA